MVKAFALSNPLLRTERVNFFFKFGSAAEEVGVGLTSFFGFLPVGNHPEVRCVVLVEQFLFVVRRERLSDDGGCDAVGCEWHPHGDFFGDPHRAGCDAFSVLGRLFLYFGMYVPTIEITAVADRFKAAQFVV